MSTTEGAVVVNLLLDEEEVQEPLRIRTLPPVRALGPSSPIGYYASQAVLESSSTHSVPEDWMMCSVKCIIAWIVYICRALRPADRKDLQNHIPNEMEIMDRLLNGQIDHDRAFREFVPKVFTLDTRNGLEFKLPNSVKDAYLAFFTEGYSQDNDLVKIGTNWKRGGDGNGGDSDGDNGNCCDNCGTPADCSQQRRTTFSTSLSQCVQWPQGQHLTAFVCNKAFKPHKNRYREVCGSCGNRDIEWFSQFESFAYLPAFLYVPLSGSYDPSQKNANDFINGGDDVLLPFDLGRVAVFDLSAVCYMSQDAANPDHQTHIIIIMRGNENRNQLYMYDSSREQQFVALQGPFPFMYVRYDGCTFYAHNLILKRRCVRAALAAEFFF